MTYRPHPPPMPGFFGYDPVQDLPQDHLARFVDCIVQESVHPPLKNNWHGQPQFDPRLLAKVLLYGYATGIRSSRQLERLCNESLPFLFLTRGDTPCYRTLCTFRVEQSELIEKAWTSLFEVAGHAGVKRMGQITIDSTKIRADASPEAVVKESEYQDVKAELKRILGEAATIDAAEDNQAPGQTRLETTLSTDQMRDILRRVRKQRGQARKSQNDPTDAPSPLTDAVSGTVTEEAIPDETDASTTADPLVIEAVSLHMRKRIEAGIEAIEAAQEEGRKHACLTDPDARMMPEGREKSIRECHAFEAAIDNKLLVVGRSTNCGTDNSRLIPIVDAARTQEPDGVNAVDSDCGYFSGAGVVKLIEEGIDVCLPDANTACDLHRDQPVGTTLSRITGTVSFDYDTEQDLYTCPEGNILRLQQTRTERGQDYRIYRAERSCKGCPLRGQCGRKERGEHRTLHVLTNKAKIEAHLARFSEAEHLQRYRRRAPAIETVFGFMRGILGYVRWQLRGSKRVASEACLFKAAYQLRKVHRCCVSSLG
jgi:transposase